MRSVGLIFKIFLADKIGSEGMGLYQLIFSVYIFASTFASSGICTAVTKLVAQSDSESKTGQIINVAFLITALAAVFSLLVMCFGAGFISEYLIHDTRAEIPLKIMSISLPFVGFSSVIRGYFIARTKTFQPSVVQVAEQTVRIAAIFILLFAFSNKGITYMAVAVVLGDTVAEIISFLLIFIFYKKDLRKREYTVSKKGILKKILIIAVPVSGSGYLSSLLHTAENLLVPIKLSVFHASKERSLSLFGAVKGMAMPILFFPASFLSSLSVMLLPEISCAKANCNTEKIKSTVKRALSLTLTLSIFTAFIFVNLGNELGMLLYSDADVGFTIKILAPIVPFMYLESISSGILKGLDRQVQMFWYNLADSVIRISAVIFLLPRFGIKGYLAIMIVSNCFTSFLCYYNLKKATEIDTDYKNWIIKPVVFGILGIAVTNMMVFNIQSLLLKIIVTAVVQAIIFFIPMILSKKENHLVLN